YTPSRLPEKTRVAVVRAYMAHHQGMTVVSMGNVVHEGATQRRFHSHPMVQAAELLLQERTPRSVAVTRPRGEGVLEAAHSRPLATMRNRGGPLRGRVFRGPGQNHAAKPVPFERSRDRGVPRGRRRASPVVGDQSREPAP